MLASQKVMDALKAIGLNLYERKLWVALLAKGSATAGELSEISGVPRSRTYDVLQSLADKGFVVVQTSKPIRYVAIPPAEALENAKARVREKMEEMISRLDSLKESEVLKELNELFEKGIQTISPEEMTGALRGKYSVMQQIESIIRNAKKQINMVMSPEGLKELLTNHYNALKKAKSRGVKIRIATTPDERYKDVIEALSGIAEVKIVKPDELPISGRMIVADGEHIIFGLTEGVHPTQDLAIWSRSPHAASKMLEPLFELVWRNATEFTSGKGKAN